MNFRQIVVTIAVLSLALLMFIVSVGCGTGQAKKTRPVTDPMECHDMDGFRHLAGKMVGIISKENTTATIALTLVTTAYADCKTERKILIKKKENEVIRLREQYRFESCKRMIYGAEVLKKEEDYKKYADFADCRKQEEK